MPLGVEQMRGTLPRGGTVIGSSRTNPYKVDGRRRAGAGHPGRARDRRADRHRRRGHAGRGPPPGRGGRGRHRRAEDDRQRPVGHGADVRLRHRGADLRRRHRPAPHDRREPRPCDGRRGDGPARRAHRRVGGHRRWRHHHADPGAALRRRGRVRRHPAPPHHGQAAGVDRRGLGGGDAEGGHDGAPVRRARRLRPRPPGRHRRRAWPSRSRRAPATRRG